MARRRYEPRSSQSALLALEAARRTGRKFHFVELEEGEDRRFAGPVVLEEPENNQIQRAAPGESKRHR